MALQCPLPDGELQIVSTLPLKYVPGLDKIPEPGDPLRLLVALGAAGTVIGRLPASAVRT